MLKTEDPLQFDNLIRAPARSVLSFRPVILCGGSGTRLWPLSRSGFPKQFLCLTSQKSLFQEAAERLLTLEGAQDLIIVCSEEHRFLVQSQLEELASRNSSLFSQVKNAALILEPEGHNTAPALTLAALASQEAEWPLVVTPADQTIKGVNDFHMALKDAISLASASAIVTLGVEPTRPETGFGYIKATSGKSSVGLEVEAFIEKPSAERAAELYKSKGYYWNAGMFVMKPDVWLSALAAQRPDILDATAKAWQTRTTDKPGQMQTFIRPCPETFKTIPSESIDYAVMEACPQSGQAIQTVPLRCSWSDLGSWDAVWENQKKESDGNALYGDVMAMGCRGTLVHASSRLVGVVGLKDTIVIETADAVLVTHSAHSQDVKKLVAKLKEENRNEQDLHRKVHRPWGWYDSIDEGDRFKVKRIQVNPGASLSLQKHHHRAEHWIVVKGTAEVTVGDKVLLLSENQSTYIPLGEVHRLRNPGTIALEIIEVQSGSYLGEDDIVRYEDQYGRSR